MSTSTDIFMCFLLTLHTAPNQSRRICRHLDASHWTLVLILLQSLSLGVVAVVVVLVFAAAAAEVEWEGSYYFHPSQLIQLFFLLPLPRICFVWELHLWIKRSRRKWVKFLDFFFNSSTYLFLWSSFLETHTAVNASSNKHSSFFLQFSGLHKSSMNYRNEKNMKSPPRTMA